MPSSRTTTTGLPPGVHVGATGPRLLAALVEVGPIWLLTVLALVFGFVLDGRLLLGVFFALLALAWGIFVWAQRATRAAGPGMRLDSLQIVGFRDGRPLGWGRVLIRWLVFAGLTVSVVGLIAMAVVMARHPRRQGWHDLAADAVVIKERPLAPARPKPAVARATPSTSQRAAPVARPAPTRPATKTTSRPGPDAVPVAAARDAVVPDAGTPVAASTAVLPSAPSDTPASSPASPPTSRTLSPAAAAALDAGEASADDDATAEAATDATVVVAEGATNGTDRADHEWWLRLDDGRDVGVAELVLLGRNPQPRVGEEDATLIKVVDDTRTVSKSHLAVGVDANGLYVMDRGSTNGTVVTGPDGGQRPCPPGDLIDVPAGSVVSFGDHWLEIRRPGD